MLEALVEPLGYDFMRRAMLVALMAAVVCAVLSCWLILVGWSLMGDAVSHAVLPGVVVAYLVGVPYAIGALVFGLLAVYLIGAVQGTSKLKEDASIGVVFTTLFALGLAIISVVRSQTDLNHILFGSILGVGPTDMTQVMVLGSVTLAVLVFKRREFTLYAFDPIHAQAVGIPARRLRALLLGLLALTVVVALQATGVVLVVALLILPGATAFLLTERFGRMLILAPSTSALNSIIGIYASYYLDAAPGPMVVLAHGAMFTAVYLAAPRRGLVSARLARRRRQTPVAS